MRPAEDRVGPAKTFPVNKIGQVVLKFQKKNNNNYRAEVVLYDIVCSKYWNKILQFTNENIPHRHTSINIYWAFPRGGHLDIAGVRMYEQRLWNIPLNTF